MVTEGLGGTGQQLTVYGHDPWGKARPTSGTGANLALLPGIFQPGSAVMSGQHEGFAGHEDLEDIGIVDMEGRIYDPEVGRFLSPDPNVQFPDSTQGYNRYTYVNNNPLSLSDPTGYYSFGAFASTGDPLAGVNPQLYGKLVGKAGMVASAVLNFVPGCQVWCGAAVTAVSQVQAGYLETGDIGDGIQQGVITGVEAFAFAEVGQSFGPSPTAAQIFERSVIEGVIGGAGAAADGGNFGSGFVGAFASSEAGPELERLGHGPGQMIVAALVGGTVSSLTGGNFADAAFAAAMQNLFNDQPHTDTGDCNDSGSQCVTVALKDGTTIRVPPEIAADVILADQQGATLGENTKPCTASCIANGATGASILLGVGEVTLTVRGGYAATTELLSAWSTRAAAVSFVVEPNTDHAVNLVIPSILRPAAPEFQIMLGALHHFLATWHLTVGDDDNGP